LGKGKVPKQALANGFWLGSVPDELKDLTFAEKMMIARVRHNRAVVRVSSGRAKMTANVIMFSNPTLSVYRMLPPSRDEMRECWHAYSREVHSLLKKILRELRFAGSNEQS
jgi:hypothetical protein